MKVTTIDKEIREILSSDFYKIPRFQRPYSWDRENVSEFWNDAIVESDQDYFIGSIVAFKDGKDTYGIVDGQQRLTTITIILCAIRNALKSIGLDSFSKGVHNFVERADVDYKLRFILQTETSYPYLQEHIQKNGSTEDKIIPGAEEELLSKAFEYFKTNIDETISGINANKTLDSKKKKERIKDTLLEIRDKVLKLKLIFITLDNEDDAYIIFETLNTRGKDLRVSDLVKNYVTKLTRPTNAGLDLTKDKWNKIVEMIEDSPVELNTDVFIHYFWLSKYDFITLKNLFKQIKKKIAKSNVQDFFKELQSDARTFREINETAYKKWKKEELCIKESLDSIILFRVKQAMPMLLSVMREYRENKITLKQTENMLRHIESFHFIFTAVTSQRSSGGISFMYAKSARELLEAKSNQKNKVLNALKNKLKDKLPNYQEFEVNFAELKYSDEFTKQKKLIQYVLSKIDAHHAKGLPVDYEKMTIEHLASQNSAGQKLKSEDVAAIGNLLLVDSELNTKLSNKPFQKKIGILENSRIHLDNSIKGKTVWESKEIRSRTKNLAKLAFNSIWKI